MPKKTVKKTLKVTNKSVKRAAKKPTKRSTKKVSVPVVAAPVPSNLPEALPPVKSEADKIWDEIKSLPIEMFALPNQIVAQHCAPVPVEPTKLYLLIKSSATLPSLETALQPKFAVELMDKYVVITRTPPKRV